MGSDHNSQSRDGGIDIEIIGTKGLESYGGTEADLTQLRVPVLLREDRPHERLYVCLLYTSRCV